MDQQLQESAVQDFVRRMEERAAQRKETDVFSYPLPFTIRGAEQIEEVKRLLEMKFDHVRIIDNCGITSIFFSRK